MTGAAGASIARFGRVQVEMLECVYQHRLLSTAQLHALYRDGLSPRRTQRALGAMERVGWLGSVREPGGMKLWFVTEAGAEAVEAIGNRAELRRKLIPPEQAAGPLQQHTLAVNEVGIAFARAARERGDEFGPLAWRNEIAHPIGRLPGRRAAEMLIADAVLCYMRSEPDGRPTFHYRFLELDRATMAVETLAEKVRRYLRLFDHLAPASSSREEPEPLWRSRYPVFPMPLVVLANGSRARLERRRDLLLALWRAEDPDAPITLFVCLLEDLLAQGPFAPIFRSTRRGRVPVDWLGDPAPDADDADAPAPDAEEERATDTETEPYQHDVGEPYEDDDQAEPVDDRRDGLSDSDFLASLRVDRARAREPWERW
jgi:hypothetical protein